MVVKGVAVNFKSYEETIPKLLKLIKFDEELKKHDKIVLKPSLIPNDRESSTSSEFTEQILKFSMENKNPGTEIFIAEGCDGQKTTELFDEYGYTSLAEKYAIGLIDLNNTETEEIENSEFLRFDAIIYPKILLDSFVISLPKLNTSEEFGITGALDNMLGAYPARYYKGFFSSTKNKLNKHPKKYQIHDILKCKMPNFTLIDASEKSTLLAGQALEMDKQASKLLGIDWRTLPHLKLIDESFSETKKVEKEVDELMGNMNIEEK